LLADNTDPPMQQQFSYAAIELVTEQGGLWIPAEAIQTARLRAGLMTGRLSLTLDDGRSVKLLWAKSSMTYEALRDGVSRWLRDQLRLD